MESGLVSRVMMRKYKFVVLLACLLGAGHARPASASQLLDSRTEVDEERAKAAFGTLLLALNPARTFNPHMQLSAASPMSIVSRPIAGDRQEHSHMRAKHVDRSTSVRVGFVSRAPTLAMSASEGLATLHVGVVGYGLVGKELVGQILSNAGKLKDELGVSIEISAVAKSKTMALVPNGEQNALSGGGWPSAEEPADLDKLGKYLSGIAEASGGRAIVVDCTASDVPAEFYEQWLKAGIDVATPNKRAGSGPYERYDKIMKAAKSGGSTFYYEATVGAGLPIVAPLQTLRRAGDKVATVGGIFSGTLSYIFNTWKPGMRFSEVVADAKDKGFTEPDPRDDLGGTDVQRKVTILARELGLKLELGDVPVESLVPEKLQTWEPPAGANLGDAFVKELANYDDEMTSLIQDAEAAGEVLRFVGAVDVKAGTASVKLSRYPKDHPFAATQFADNIVTFETEWYTPRPLVVQGPGAGAAVTAAGIFGNVMESMMKQKDDCVVKIS